jgi:putative membrane protein
MHWYNNSGGMGSGGYVLMMVGVVLFAGLVVATIAVLTRGGDRNRPSGRLPSMPRTPETILAERFARGEIDDDEYQARMDGLRRQVSPKR